MPKIAQANVFSFVVSNFLQKKAINKALLENLKYVNFEVVIKN